MLGSAWDMQGGWESAVATASGTARHSLWHCTALHDTVRHSTARHGRTRYGTARHGTSRYDMAWRIKAEHGTVGLLELSHVLVNVPTRTQPENSPGGEKSKHSVRTPQSIDPGFNLFRCHGLCGPDGTSFV